MTSIVSLPTTVVFPPPPPTTNALTPEQRSQLRKSTKKLGKILGATPHLLDTDIVSILGEYPFCFPPSLLSLSLQLSLFQSFNWSKTNTVTRFFSYILQGLCTFSSHHDTKPPHLPFLNPQPIPIPRGPLRVAHITPIPTLLATLSSGEFHPLLFHEKSLFLSSPRPNNLTF